MILTLPHDPLYILCKSFDSLNIREFYLAIKKESHATYGKELFDFFYGSLGMNYNNFLRSHNFSYQADFMHVILIFYVQEQEYSNQ